MVECLAASFGVKLSTVPMFVINWDGQHRHEHRNTLSRSDACFLQTASEIPETNVKYKIASKSTRRTNIYCRTEGKQVSGSRLSLAGLTVGGSKLSLAGLTVGGTRLASHVVLFRLVTTSHETSKNCNKCVITKGRNS